MEKKRSRRRKDDGYTGPGEQQNEAPTKMEYIVAKWMKKNLKIKKTKFLNHNVEYFTANRAVDALLKSKFVEGNDALFTTREQVIDYLDVMLEHKFFHRARKVPVTLDEVAACKDKEKESLKEKDEKKSKEKKREKDSKQADAETEKESGTEKVKEKEKRKRKIRLEMHAEQLFVDGSEAYVWIYDPIPIHYWIYGLILLLGAIGICLFPLWPPILRKGVYYLSVAAAGFLVFILALTIVRLIIFTIAWALTAGKLHFWIFPNLTEDVGFFASFWPLYESNYLSNEKSKSEKKSKSKSKKQKSKDSDAEDDAVTSLASDTGKSTDVTNQAEHVNDMELRQRQHKDKLEADSQDDNNDANTKSSSNSSESESEISGKDYEIINPIEVQNVN